MRATTAVAAGRLHRGLDRADDLLAGGFLRRRCDLREVSPACLGRFLCFVDLVVRGLAHGVSGIAHRVHGGTDGAHRRLPSCESFAATRV